VYKGIFGLLIESEPNESLEKVLLVSEKDIFGGQNDPKASKALQKDLQAFHQN